MRPVTLDATDHTAGWAATVCCQPRLAMYSFTVRQRPIVTERCNLPGAVRGQQAGTSGVGNRKSLHYGPRRAQNGENGRSAYRASRRVSTATVHLAEER